MIHILNVCVYDTHTIKYYSSTHSIFKKNRNIFGQESFIQYFKNERKSYEKEWGEGGKVFVGVMLLRCLMYLYGNNIFITIDFM